MTDPVRLADLLLAMVASGRCDAVFVEPVASGSHSIAFEHGGGVFASHTIESKVAATTIARLAFVAGIDLVERGFGGSVRVLVDDAPGEVVVTIRPGRELRAELSLLPSSRHALAQEIELGPQSTVGPYRIVKRLGEGGMGTVYAVEHAVLGNVRAMKVLRGELFERRANAGERFLHEARAAARVDHQNIVQVFDFGYLPDARPYFVMELLTGESLADKIDRGALSPAIAVAVARQIATGLVAAHDLGVVHADVTPTNIYVTSMEPLVVKLLDFGLAQLLGEGVMEETKGVVLGTPAYISPEQLRGLPPSDRSDQYSFGIVLFEMLAGKTPYVDRDVQQLCMHHLSSPIPTVTSVHEPLDPDLAALVTGCLQKAPQARLPGMRAVLAALDDIAHRAERAGWQRFLS